MKLSFLLVLSMCLSITVLGQTITGTVTDAKTGDPLPFASIYLKGTTRGTTTNDQGKFTLNNAKEGNALICRYVSYEKQEKVIGTSTKINFGLSAKHTKIRMVTITNDDEDPAYRIIREAIKKRPLYNKEIDAFIANCYVKGKMKLDQTPQLDGLMKMFAGTSNDEDPQQQLDSMRGIIYLAESYSKITYQRKPKNFKIKVLSSKVSGAQEEYGFSSPMFLNFYENNVSYGSQLSPRGFVSPIARGALRFYRYKLLESYFEDGQWINRIQVTPRRKLEPVFSGEIHIISQSWRIHSLDLMVTKENELAFMDTIRTKQIHVPVDEGYAVKDQTFSFKFKLLGFGTSGQFVNVFTNYSNDIDANDFDRYVIEYDSLALKQNKQHWDSIRVIPLDEEEVNDYIKKDSIAKTDKARLDSLSARPFSYKAKDIIQSGIGYKFSKNETIKSGGLIGLNRIKYNTIEGLAYELPIRYNKKIDKDKKLYVSAHGRYGFSNRRFNAKAFGRYTWGKSNKSAIRIGGGQYNMQYNNSEPVNELLNAFSTLLYGNNYLKIYQARFATVSYSKYLFSGFNYKLGLDYQYRESLANTTNYMFKWFKKENNFTSNYPSEIQSSTMPNNRRLALSVGASYQPGRKLIKYPDRIVSAPSRYPTFYAGVEVARPLLNTDASYSRWRAGLRGSINLKLYGDFSYQWDVGGFIDKKTVYTPDYIHFNGNQLILASPYLNSFQLASYYANSNTEAFYSSFHAEHHFNGLGTNKIPLFRKLKYNLVAATNGFYVNQHNNYIELSAGLENIGFGLFRFFRIDGVVGYQNFDNPVFGIRVGIGGGMFSVGTSGDADE